MGEKWLSQAYYNYSTCYTTSWDNIETIVEVGSLPRDNKGCNEKFLIYQVQKTNRSSLTWKLNASQQCIDKINRNTGWLEVSPHKLAIIFFLHLGESNEPLLQKQKLLLLEFRNQIVLEFRNQIANSKFSNLAHMKIVWISLMLWAKWWIYIQKLILISMEIKVW